MILCTEHKNEMFIVCYGLSCFCHKFFLVLFEKYAFMVKEVIPKTFSKLSMNANAIKLLLLFWNSPNNYGP